MKKLNLDFAKWLWAINRDKVAEFYRDNYGGNVIAFTNGIGGSIVKHFFMKDEKLLSMAYRNLSYNWNINLWSAYPKNLEGGKFSSKESLDFNEFSWLLFKSLSHVIEVETINELVDGDWRSLWRELDEKYFEEEENEN